MTFDEILAQVLDLLQREKRLSYRAIKVRFGLDDEHLAAIKDEIIEAKQLAVDDRNVVLVWTGDAASTSPITASTPVRVSFATMPAYLSEKIRTTKDTLAGERKQVTVLFADIKDSTELIRGLDPEVAQRLLDPALHHMMVAVHRYEGTVNQVLGDGIMALFGAPLAHEDHALRACYAALAMQAAHGATSASGKSPCQPCTPVPGLPYAMPNWECSLRVVPSGQKGGRLLRRWRTPVAACGPTGESVCCASAKATCPGHCHSSNGLWAFVTR